MCYSNPGRTGLIGAPTYPMLRDSTLTALLETLNENDIPFDLNRSENVLTMREGESRILLRSVSDFERLRGTNLAWFGVDELTYTQEEVWQRLEGRLRDPKATRYCGFAVWTPKGFDWVHRKFIEKPLPGFEVVRASPFENKYLLEQVPDFYERLKSSYDENFYRQEALGDYLNSKGDLVYHAYRPGLNLRAQTLDERSPVCWTLDFNVDPMSSLVVQLSRDGGIRVLDEIVLKRATTEQACEEFEKRFGKPPEGVIVFGDASGSAMHTTGHSDYQMIRSYFAARMVKATYRVPKGNPAVRDRVALVNSKLRNARGEVSLQIDPRCKELIADFEQVAYEEDSTQIDKNKDRRRTHLSDALGYLIWQEQPQKPIGERGERLF